MGYAQLLLVPARLEALLRRDMTEALRQSGIVRSIRGPQPPSPLALRLIDRFNRLAAKNALKPERE